MKLTREQKLYKRVRRKWRRHPRVESGRHGWAMSRGYMAMEGDLTGQELANVLREIRECRWRNKCFWRSRRGKGR